MHWYPGHWSRTPTMADWRLLNRKQGHCSWTGHPFEWEARFSFFDWPHGLWNIFHLIDFRQNITELSTTNLPNWYVFVASDSSLSPWPLRHSLPAGDTSNSSTQWFSLTLPPTDSVWFLHPLTLSDSSTHWVSDSATHRLGLTHPPTDSDSSTQWLSPTTPPTGLVQLLHPLTQSDSSTHWLGLTQPTDLDSSTHWVSWIPPLTDSVSLLHPLTDSSIQWLCLTPPLTDSVWLTFCTHLPSMTDIPPPNNLCDPIFSPLTSGTWPPSLVDWLTLLPMYLLLLESYVTLTHPPPPCDPLWLISDSSSSKKIVDGAWNRAISNNTWERKHNLKLPVWH